MIDTSYRPRPKPSYRVRRWTELEARQVERRERAFEVRCIALVALVVLQAFTWALVAHHLIV